MYLVVAHNKNSSSKSWMFFKSIYFIQGRSQVSSKTPVVSSPKSHKKKKQKQPDKEHHQPQATSVFSESQRHLSQPEASPTFAETKLPSPKQLSKKSFSRRAGGAVGTSTRLSHCQDHPKRLVWWCLIAYIKPNQTTPNWGVKVRFLLCRSLQIPAAAPLTSARRTSLRLHGFGNGDPLHRCPAFIQRKVFVRNIDFSLVIPKHISLLASDPVETRDFFLMWICRKNVCD